MFKKLSTKLGLAVFGALVAIPVVGPYIAKAAADTGFASSTEALGAVFTDNSSNVWIWIGLAIGFSLLLGLGIRALLFGKRQIIGAVPGGRRGRR